MAIFNDNIKTMIKNISNNEDFFDILVPLRACQMTISLETALGGDWELEVKQRYLKQFNEYVSFDYLHAKRLLFIFRDKARIHRKQIFYYSKFEKKLNEITEVWRL